MYIKSSRSHSRCKNSTSPEFVCTCHLNMGWPVHMLGSNDHCFLSHKRERETFWTSQWNERKNQFNVWNGYINQPRLRKQLAPIERERVLANDLDGDSPPSVRSIAQVFLIDLESPWTFETLILVTTVTVCKLYFLISWYYNQWSVLTTWNVCDERDALARCVLSLKALTSPEVPEHGYFGLVALCKSSGSSWGKGCICTVVVEDMNGASVKHVWVLKWW